MRKSEIYKVVCVGLHNSGIKDLLEKYSSEVFFKSSTNTVGVDFFVKTIKYEPDKTLRMQIWMMRDDENILDLFDNYVIGAHALVLVFDVTDKKTFTGLFDILNRKQDFHPNLMTFIVGTNSDKYPWQIQSEDVEEIVDLYDCEYFNFVSVNKHEHVDDLFIELAEKLSNIEKKDLEIFTNY